MQDYVFLSDATAAVGKHELRVVRQAIDYKLLQPRAALFVRSCTVLLQFGLNRSWK